VGGSLVGRVWQPTCSLSVSWHGEAFHKLGVQGAKVSALPGAFLSQACPQHLLNDCLMACVSIQNSSLKLEVKVTEIRKENYYPDSTLIQIKVRPVSTF
jgi:hypothetical protein